jgi:meso-butanediol dehydrogenase / (S,S)-butanediol dehydrogenase / diacetyl reductase
VRRGHPVGILDLREQTASAVVAEIRAAGGEAVATGGDVVDEAALRRAVSAVVERYGPLEGVFANAGETSIHGDLFATSPEAWRRSLEVNVTGVYLTARCTFPHLLRTQGAFLVTASVGGVTPPRGLMAYNVGKAAAITLARTLALEYGDRGVRSNVIAPGEIETDIHQRWLGLVREDTVEKLRATIPMGRWGRPEEVALVAAHLLGPESAYTNGLVYVVDGGLTAGNASVRWTDEPIAAD